VLAYDDSDGCTTIASSQIINGSHDAAQDQAVCTGKPTTGG